MYFLRSMIPLKITGVYNYFHSSFTAKETEKLWNALKATQ